MRVSEPVDMCRLPERGLGLRTMDCTSSSVNHEGVNSRSARRRRTPSSALTASAVAKDADVGVPTQFGPNAAVGIDIVSAVDRFGGCLAAICDAGKRTSNRFWIAS
jgi:hypothetical protein